MCRCLASSRGLESGRREKEPKQGQNEAGGAEGLERTHLKKKREGQRVGRQKEKAGGERREREAEGTGEGAKRVTSSRAASAHGAGGEVVGK